MKSCTLKGCERAHFAKGMCNTHYSQNLRTGSPHPKKRPGDIERLWSKIDVENSLGCWIWNSTQDKSGYGVFHLNSKSVSAHRAVYETLMGAIPDGLELDHLCRVKNCVNPDHLEPVTHKENMLRALKHRSKRKRCTDESCRCVCHE